MNTKIQYQYIKLMIPLPVRPVLLKQKEGHRLYIMEGGDRTFSIQHLTSRAKFDFKTKPRCAIRLYYISISKTH